MAWFLLRPEPDSQSHIGLPGPKEALRQRCRPVCLHRIGVWTAKKSGTPVVKKAEMGWRGMFCEVPKSSELWQPDVGSGPALRPSPEAVSEIQFWWGWVEAEVLACCPWKTQMSVPSCS